MARLSRYGDVPVPTRSPYEWFSSTTHTTWSYVEGRAVCQPHNGRSAPGSAAAGPVADPVRAHSTARRAPASKDVRRCIRPVCTSAERSGSPDPADARDTPVPHCADGRHDSSSDRAAAPTRIGDRPPGRPARGPRRAARRGPAVVGQGLRGGPGALDAPGHSAPDADRRAGRRAGGRCVPDRQGHRAERLRHGRGVRAARGPRQRSRSRRRRRARRRDGRLRASRPLRLRARRSTGPASRRHPGWASPSPATTASPCWTSTISTPQLPRPASARAEEAGFVLRRLPDDADDAAWHQLHDLVVETYRDAPDSEGSVEQLPYSVFRGFLPDPSFVLTAGGTASSSA